MSRRSGDLVRSALQLVALGALLVACLWVVRPFLLAATWATTIAVALWPLLLRLQARLGGSRGWAVTVLTALLALVVVIPVYVGVQAIVDNAGDLARLPQAFAHRTIPPPPSWLDGFPLVGERIATEWRVVAAETPEARAARVAPYARDAARWLVSEMGSLGALLLHFVLTVVLSAVLFASGERAAAWVERFALRLAGPPGARATLLAAQAIRAVALGVVLTAVLQSTLVALGFFVVGVPFAAVLTAVCFVLSIAQIGPIPILIGVVAWVYSAHGPVWGSGYLLWAVLCGIIDNFVRPVLIQRGADLPLLLIFAGVIGGLVAFGVVGLFIGPVLLAVAYMLLAEWMAEGEA